MPYQTQNEPNLTASITRYIFILIATIGTFALIVIVFLLWQFKLFSDIENQINQYHLPSIEHINNLNTEYHVFLDWMYQNKLHKANDVKRKPKLQKQINTRFLNFIHVTERSLELLFELHQRNGTKVFTPPVSRLKTTSKSNLRQIIELNEQKTLSSQSLEASLEQFNIAKDQLKRLHSQNQHQLYTDLAKAKKIYQRVLFAIILILFSIGAVITHRIIKLIKSILLKTKEDTRVLTEFKNTLDSTTDCVFIFNPDSLKFTYVNKGAIEQVKYSYDEMIEMTPVDIKPKFNEKQFREMIKPLYKSETSSVTFETFHEDKHGHQIPVEIFLEYIHLPDEQAHFVAIVRDITERKQVYETINFLANARTSGNLEPFLQECILNLTEVYNCKYAFIGLLIEPQRSHVRTLAVRAGNHYAENFEYPLEGTPCKDIINQDKSIIETNAAKLYPDDQMLIDMEVDSYFGSPLITTEGKTIGLVSVLDTKPMSLTPANASILDVFSTRLATEFERIMALEDLSSHQHKLEETIIKRTKDLESAKHEAEEASKSKSIFLSNMSHELRTPMNAILGFAQVLELDAKDDSTRQSVDEILRAGNHLLELINEVLDLTKIESGHLNLSLDKASLNELVAECIGIILPMINNNNLEFINNIAADKDYLVRIDFTRAKQVLLNLLSNAVKYNQENGYISLNAEIIGPDRIKILVTDSGKGLSIEQQKKLFQPFERAGAEYSNIEGTGIGLVISKQLMELMGGKIGLESTPGVGSTFWVEFKLIEEKALPKKQKAKGSAKTTKENLITDKNKVTILYIEDNPANLRLIEELLERKPYITLVSAHEPVLGLDLAKSKIPHLILLDINLPGMNGYEVLKILKKSKELKHIPVVAISANAMAGDVRHGLEAGFDDYLPKPINISEFFNVIDRYCPKKRKN